MKKILEGKADLIVANLSDLLLGDGFHNIHTVEDILSFIWTRKAKEADEFQLVVPATQENIQIYIEDRLIVCNDYKYMCYEKLSNTYVVKTSDQVDLLNDIIIYPFTDVAGIIEKVEVIAPNGPDDVETMTISGRSLESIFDRRIVWESRELVTYDGSDITGDTAEAKSCYTNFMTNVNSFLEYDVICPPVTGKKKKKSGLNFQNRAIWNILMGNYGQARDGDSDVEKRSRTANAYMKKLFTSGEAQIMNLNGDSIYEVLKKLCSTYGLSMRTYLMINVNIDPSSKYASDALNLGKYDSVYISALKAVGDGVRDLVIPARCSWIFLELDAPCNRSYLENTTYDYVVFSQNIDNLANVSYARDVAQIKNITRIMGEDKGKETRFSTVYSGEYEPTGLSRREIFTDASNIKLEDINEKNTKKKKSQYMNLIEAEGRNNLTSHSRSRNFMFNGDALEAGNQKNIYTFGQDYFVGDLVQFVDELFAQSARVQIAEIVESINENGYEFSMTYDTPAIDFVKEDPLGYYYYTTDDDDNLITITGIKLAKVMEDGLKCLDPVNAYYSLNKKEPMNFKYISDIELKDGEKVKITITGDTTKPNPGSLSLGEATTVPILDAYEIGLDLIYSV